MLHLTAEKQQFSAADARQISGASQRQLDYWDDRDIVPASIRRKGGKGRERQYSYTDLVKLRVVVELRQAGVSLQRIRKALGILRDWDPKGDPLAIKRIVADGNDVFVATLDRKTLKSVTERGQLVFTIFVIGDIVNQAQRTIKLHMQKRRTGS